MKKLLSLILVSVLLIMCAACSGAGEEGTSETPESTSLSEEVSTENAEDKFSAALYTEDTEIGEGETVICLHVVTPESTVKFTLHTDKTILGDALIDSGIVEGEEGPYGLYIRKVNGISAVFEEDSAYWSLSVNGESAATGADGIEIEDGMNYELTYTEE